MTILRLDVGETGSLFPASEISGFTFAPLDRVKEMRDEVEVINYMIDYIMQARRGFTQRSLAAEMGTSAMVITKMRHGDAGIPRNSIMKFVECCKSYALVQYLVEKCGSVMISKREYGVLLRSNEEQIARIQELEKRLSMYEDVRNIGE